MTNLDPSLYSQPNASTRFRQAQPNGSAHRLRNLPLRERPAYRIARNASTCSLPELLAGVIGGEKQIEIADALLAHCQAHPDELARVSGIITLQIFHLPRFGMAKPCQTKY